MPFRSFLFVPGNKQQMLDSAARSEADVLLLDLEDSVPTAGQKQKARELIVDYLNQGVFDGRKVFVRVNGLRSGELLRDVRALSATMIEGFMFPKARTEKDVSFFCRLLEATEYEVSRQVGSLKVIPLIETTHSLIDIDQICKASQRVPVIAFGSEDFIDDLSGSHEEEDIALSLPRAMIPIAARANNLVPIDTVHLEVHNLDSLKKKIQTSKALGYQGMLALHPGQLIDINNGFMAIDTDLKHARQIVEAYERAKLNNEGIALIRGEVIGPPMYKAAIRLLEKFEKETL